ncbi:hypothetical protein N7488_008903 [Penicillium malachiteum]|nr:hypothetical protein N7488_008903 [Penicillium malachiteum]
MASLLLKLNRPDNAEIMLKIGSAMILLRKIRATQGLPDKALRLASKALSFRKECLGERLKVSDSHYQLIFVSDLMREVIRISEKLTEVEGIGHISRANKKLAEIKKDLRTNRESKKYLEKALPLKDDFDSLHGDRRRSEKVASDFEALVPWML